MNAFLVIIKSMYIPKFLHVCQIFWARSKMEKREQTIFCKNDDWQGFQLLYFYTKVDVVENQFHNQYKKIKIRMNMNELFEEILIHNIKFMKNNIS